MLIGDNWMQTNSGTFSSKIYLNIWVAIEEAEQGFAEAIEAAKANGIPFSDVNRLESMSKSIFTDAKSPMTNEVNVWLANKLWEFVNTFSSVTEWIEQSMEIGKKLSDSAVKLFPVIMPMIAKWLWLV